MSTARTRGVALVGLTGHLVDVEAHLGGMPGFSIGGLPDSSVMQARDRVRAAVLSSGLPWPTQRITANLSPASLPKSGTHYDLALALAVLAADGTVPAAVIADTVMMAELTLDGRLRAVPGVLPAVVAAQRRGARGVIVASANAAEARLIADVNVFGARTLCQVVAFLRDELVPDDPEDELVGCDRSAGAGGLHGAVSAGAFEGASGRGTAEHAPDMSDVSGQLLARQALEVAAAGGHHVSFVGPPGAGKTMLARRLPGLLPELDLEDALEVSALHSIAGTLPAGEPLLRVPPYSDPHHTASPVSIVGGGSPLRPGAISLAHRGVLFMDEAPEFNPSVLDALRQPLEHGSLLVSRAKATVRFPARFLLVLAANPCPCGFHGVAGRTCQCPPERVRRYAMRVSGPIRDRIDLHVSVSPVRAADLAVGPGESSAQVAGRVAEARLRQRERLKSTPWKLNSEVPGAQLRTAMPVSAEAQAPTYQAVGKGRVTARGAAQALRVAWTLADLAGRDQPNVDDVNLALMAHAAGTVQ